MKMSRYLREFTADDVRLLHHYKIVFLMSSSTSSSILGLFAFA